MSLDADDAAIRDAMQRLSPYARGLVEAAGREAWRIHADEVGPEHVLLALMADEECAAHRAVLAAFADPETIGQEALALAEGILVVSSAGAVPFSHEAVTALRAARRKAAARGAATLDGDALLAAAVEALEPGAREALAEAGFGSSALEPVGAGPGLDPTAPLFRDTTEEARRVLSGAAHRATAEGCDAILPAHLILASLEDTARAARAGIRREAARQALGPIPSQVAPPPPRRLPASEALLGFLGGLPEGAGSLELLGELCGPRWPEPAALLARHRVTAAWAARAARGVQDPG